LRVTGGVSAIVGQTCVVTLEPVENAVEEAVDLAFTPAVAPRLSPVEDDTAAATVAASDTPEPLTGNSIDLGAIAIEFLLLGIDPYPRKADAVFEPPPAAGDAAEHPFAALATLKKSSGGHKR
jgi:hypothetical protein